MREGRGVIFVRHAMPEVRRGLGRTLWPLTERAREDCVLLAHALPGRLAPVILSSAETKAQETATIIALRRGLQTAGDDRLGEVDRPEDWDEDYRGTAEGYLVKGGAPGWEPREAVVKRVGMAVGEQLSGEGEGDVVVVSHGLAISVYLASVAGVEVTGFWEGLAFPDAWRWEPGSSRLERLFRAGVPPDQSVTHPS